MKVVTNELLLKARTEAYYRGNLSWKLHAGQHVIEKAYREVTNTLFVGNCSRRLGKSYWAAIKCIEKAISTKSARVKIATAYQTDLEEFILPAFTLALEDCPEPIRPKWNASKKKFRFKNGSEIQLVGLDKNPNAGRGNYCDLYIFDEAAYIRRLSYLYSSVVVPMTARRPGARVIMISTPPPEGDSEFPELCQKARRENAYVELDIFKNPLIDAEERERLHRECLAEDDWEREYLCKFVVSKSKAIIPEFIDSAIKVNGRDEFFKYYHKYDAMDLGVRDKTVCLFAYYDFKRAKLVIESEYVINGPEMTTDKLAEDLKAREAALWPELVPYRRVSDNNNLLLLQDLGRLHGIHFSPTNKEELHAMVDEVRWWVKQERIEINPECTELIGCLRYGTWNDKRREFARSKVYGHFDALAALIYLVRNINQEENPIPVSHGGSFNHYIPQDEGSSTARELKKIFG